MPTMPVPIHASLLLNDKGDGDVIFTAPCNQEPIKRSINSREQRLMQELKRLLEQAEETRHPSETLQSRIKHVKSQLCLDIDKEYLTLLAQTN